MISIRNSQRTVSVDKEKIAQQAQHILEIIGYPDFDLGIWLSSDQTIRKYNREYRHKDKVTDILSFPAHPDAVAGKKIKVCCEDEMDLGDLIIAPSYVLKAAEREKKSFEDHLTHLLIHGILHLCGYDHEKDVDYRRMRLKEVAVLKKLQQK
jgi:probable rRNA maturation factor